MEVIITGFNPPGRMSCGPDGSVMANVHVGVQVRRDPDQLVPADEAKPAWAVTVEVIDRDGTLDFRGLAVQGKRGERFLYLTWGDVTSDGGFEMFRRAKLMLHRVDPAVMAAARAAGRLQARVDLTGEDGGPRCARVDPPAITWSVPG